MKNQKRAFSRRYYRLQTAVIVIALALCAVLIAGCGDNSSKEQTVELKLAHFWPSTHPIETKLVQPWAKEINEATKGQVKIYSYPGETLLKAPDVYSGVVSGAADFGLSCFSYSPGRFPFCEVFEMPGVTYTSSKSSGRVAWEVIQEYNPTEVQDTRLLMVLSTGPGDIYSKQPVRNLEDLRGMEIRATGISTKALSALGATPVYLSQAEAYDALSKGVVKGNLGPDEVLKGWNQAEITKYVTKTPFLYNTLFFFNVNIDTWESLDAATQKTISEITEKYFSTVALTLWDDQNEEALAWAQREKGMEVIELSSDESERWRQALASIQKEWSARITSSGVSGDTVLRRIQELANLYNQ
jgi:TRAP-type C4-dicarboxylate transport system substrate-binding protein